MTITIAYIVAVVWFYACYKFFDYRNARRRMIQRNTVERAIIDASKH